MFLAQATLENHDVTEPGRPYFEDAEEGCLGGRCVCFLKKLCPDSSGDTARVENPHACWASKETEM